ncbi:hypothetical protein A3F27_02855 [Candidatus Kaiserbacteria bacterium RIFCSPHIGHO2_12_FULL_53_13]|uniref:Cell division protein FtsL n=1 Tax=Candidatus Kaiserbacteria bacterium RIFCSPHIGHO2_12_FULL_53_13 TaxID=1798502 RepID=A0A1F6EDB5_9BACT|nr:MAG: hypothetical protein A3F27_02855 [Candidatus Kaiserbacteria bacterium RIFCSPHIGHO2_12_FULL_53_13]OGG74767.1 MAG: hypothetical protein A3A37_00185 [Candidatus Kaiserbacteria bacterium RIFCSPLOWO2_01_FULL_52_36]
MRTFEQRRDPLRLFGRRLLLLALLGVVVAAFSGVWGVYRKERESKALRVEAEAQLADLSQRRIQLEADILKLKTSRGMEEILREQYRLAKSGEGLVIIVDPPTSAPTEDTSPVMEWFSRAFSWW